MSASQDALFRYGGKKCGEVEPEYLAANLAVPLGTATVPLNRA